MPKIQVALPSSLKKKLKHRAKDHGVSMAEVVRKYIESGLTEAWKFCFACGKEIKKRH